ncbi:hypothetical protein Tco_0383184 [Tanacetum coccineum]
MTTLQFVDTHNLVAFLAKPAESEGFEQVVDFLNAHTIKYTLTANPTIYTSCIEQFWATIKVKMINGEQQLQALVDGKKIVVTEESVRRDLQLDDEEGTDCLPNATIFEELTRIGTMASAIICLATNQKFNFSKYIFESMVKNLVDAGKFLMYQRKDFSGRVTPLFLTMVVQAQEEMGEGGLREKDHIVPQSSVPSDPTNVADEAVNEEPSNATSGIDNYFVPNYNKDLENTKTAQAQEITSLKKREDASKQRKKIHDIDDDEDITLENVHDDDIMLDVSDLASEEVFVEKEVHVKEVSAVGQVNTATVSTASTIPVSAATITEDETTLAQALTELKSAKPTTTASTISKSKGLVIHEEEQAATLTVSSQQPSQIKVQDKAKEEEEEEERLAREKVEANVALTEEWNDIQAKIEADQLLAERLQAREQEELTIEERAKLFQQLLEKRRKFFVAKRAEKNRNRPPTRAQQRSIMCTYLKNMAGWKPKDLKNKSFANIQELFDKAFKRVNTFVDFRTELVEGTEMEESSKKAEVMEESSKRAEIAQESSSKRAGDELEQENAKKQKAKMKEFMKIIPDEEEVAIDAISLAIITKYC